MSVSDKLFDRVKGTRKKLPEIGLNQRTILYAITTLGLLSLVSGPIIFFVWGSFWTTEPGAGGHFTLEGYQQLWDPVFIETILNTLIIAVGGTALTLGLAIFLLLVTVKMNIRGKEFIRFVIITQYLLPTYLLAFGWTFYVELMNRFLLWLPFFSGQAPLSVYSLWGIVVVGATHYAGLVYLLTTGAMEAIPVEVEESALVSGATKATIFRKITLPLVFPSLAIAAILVFTRFSQSFGFPLILGLPERIYVVATIMYTLLTTFPRDFAPAAAMGVIMLSVTLLGLYVQRRVTGSREKYETIGGKSSDKNLTFDLGRFRTVATIGTNAFVILIFLGPLLMVFLMSLLSHRNIVTFTIAEFSLDSYRTLFWGGRSAKFWSTFWNTIWVAGLGAFLGMVLSSFVSYIVIKSRSGLGAVLDFISLAPVAIPGIVVGAAFLWLFLTYNFLGLYGTLWLLMLALTAKFIVYGTRSTNASFRSIGEELEEAAELSGASLFGTFRHIFIPLIKPGFVAGYIILFVDYIKILSIPLLLTTDKTVLSAYLFQLVMHPLSEHIAGAVATVMITIIALIYGIMFFFTDIDILKL